MPPPHYINELSVMYKLYVELVLSHGVIVIAGDGKCHILGVSDAHDATQ